MAVSVTELFSVTEPLKPATHIGDSAMASGGANCCGDVNPDNVNLGGGDLFCQPTQPAESRIKIT